MCLLSFPFDLIRVVEIGISKVFGIALVGTVDTCFFVPLLGKPERVRSRSSTNVCYRQTSFIGEELLYDMFSAEEF